MKDHGRLAPLSLGILLGLGLVGGAVRSAFAADAHATAAQATADDVTRATLDNGLRVVIVRDRLAPVVTTQITYLAGSYEAPKGFPGTAHALEHMMFRDSKGLTGAQLNELTGKMGAGNNAFTTNDATQFYFAAPVQYLDMLLRIEAIRMRGARLTDRDWDLEKGAIEQEVSGDISDPSYLAYAQAERILYAGTGYAEDALGSRPSFDKTNGAILQKFYDRWYVPNNAILVIVGDVDPQAALARVKQLFGPIAKGNVPARAPVNLKPFKPQTIARSTPGATGSVQFVFRMPGQQSKDYAAMKVLLDVLGNARSNLSQLAAQGKVISADTDMQPFAHGGIGLVEVGFPKGGDSKQAEAQLDGVVAEMLKGGLPSDLVEAAKRQERARFEFRKNSATSLAGAWSEALAWQGLQSPQEMLDRIEQVNVDDVNRVAREYLKPEQRLTVVLTPNPDGKRPPDSQGFGGSEQFASDDKLDTPLPEWATAQLAKLEMPRWTLSPTQMKLSNGITLIVQPETVSKTVTVMGHVDHNDALQEPKGQEGVGKLMGSLFDYGTTTLDRGAFHKALDVIAATESAGGDFKLAVPSENFDQGMKLLADNELHPAFPQSAFDVQQKTLADTRAGELQSPQYKMMRALDKGLYPAGDPALREATPGTVNALTLKDVRDYFARVYRPDMTTIVVVGDVAPQQAKAVVEEYFGAWKAVGTKPDVIPKPVPVNPSSYTAVPNDYASQDDVLLGQMLDLDLHDPDRYALELGNDVLGGGGAFSSRLMLEIRVKHGYAYGAYSSMEFDRSRSTFYVGYGSDPSKVAPVDKLVKENLMLMQSSLLKPDELTNAKQARIRSIPLDVSSVDGIAKSLLKWSYQGEPLNEPMVAAEHYLALTAQQVRDAFAKYVKPAHLVQVVQGPVPKQH
ncbi:peptidase [Frateuria sp. Soil773]|uniref:M16 family metallopeptidase n=1 Tax=Frateuria sp. Soil773 TaxID=1736407 RepID=UPI0006FDFDEA|nr:pitrilysin family protein [Frateuria sp. Soil773]KRE89459.1 peptidase [Frateuria sp. Soil773]